LSLTPKQIRFVEEYPSDFNATQAAIRAGYSQRSARSQGSRMMTNVDIQRELARRADELVNPDSMTLEQAIIELSKLARTDMQTYAKWGPDGVELLASVELPAGATAAVAEVVETITSAGRSVRFKLHGKLGALDSIVKIRQWQLQQANLEARIAALEERLDEFRSNPHPAGRPGYPVNGQH